MQDYQECANAIRDFGSASAYPINETVTNYPTIIKAASVTDEDLQSVTQWIGSQGLVKDLVMMGWVPHYETGNYGVVDHWISIKLRGFEANAVGVLIEGDGKIEGPPPSFPA